MPVLPISAGIIQRQGRVLICQRAQGTHCGGRWEFPGGKQEHGETAAECLVRECREELALTLRVRQLFARFDWADDRHLFRFSFFLAEIASGEPICREHAALFWALPDELPQYSFCPADTSLLPAIRRFVM